MFVLAAAITALLLMATVVTDPLTFFRLLKFLHTYAAVIVVWTIGVVVAALISGTSYSCAVLPSATKKQTHLRVTSWEHTHAGACRNVKSQS